MTRSRALLLALLTILACAREPGPIATSPQASQAKVQFDRGVLLQSLTRLGFEAEVDTARVRRSREVFRALPCAVPDEVALLFAVHPGADSKLRPEGQRWLSASAAHAAYDSLRSEHGWRANWIPVIRRPTGWLVVESSRGTSPAGPVLEVRDGGGAKVFGVNLSVLAEGWSRD